MNELEQKYYEDAAFWHDGMLEDSRNMERFRIENQSVISNGLTDDLCKQSFDPSDAIFATAL